MSTKDKLLARLNGSPKDFTWKECMTLLGFLGCDIKEGNGSRIKVIFRGNSTFTLHIHKPHPGHILDSGRICDIKKFIDQFMGDVYEI